MALKDKALSENKIRDYKSSVASTKNESIKVTPKIDSKSQIENKNLKTFFSQLNKLQIQIEETDKKEIVPLLNKYSGLIDNFIDMLKSSREIFNDRDLILKSNKEMNNYLDLVVRQNVYFENDELDDLIYKAINYNSNKFVKEKMKVKILVYTDYNTSQPTNNAHSKLI